MNQKGMSLIELMLVVTIMGVLMLALSSMLSNQHTESKAVAEKLAKLEVERELIVALRNNNVCKFELQDKTFNASASPVTVELPLIHIVDNAASPILAEKDKAPTPMSNSLIVQEIRVTSITLQPSASNPNDRWVGDLIIRFDGSKLVRSLTPIIAKVTIETDPASPANAKKIVNCIGGEVAGADVCNADNEGKMRYSKDESSTQYCDGSQWVNLDSNGSHGAKTFLVTSTTAGNGSSDTFSWTVPDTVTRLIVSMTGGGGGGHGGDGGSGGGGGGAGSFINQPLKVKAGEVCTILVGRGGLGGPKKGAGGDGGRSEIKCSGFTAQAMGGKRGGGGSGGGGYKLGGDAGGILPSQIDGAQASGAFGSKGGDSISWSVSATCWDGIAGSGGGSLFGQGGEPGYKNRSKEKGPGQKGGGFGSGGGGGGGNSDSGCGSLGNWEGGEGAAGFVQIQW